MLDLGGGWIDGVEMDSEEDLNGSGRVVFIEEGRGEGLLGEGAGEGEGL